MDRNGGTHGEDTTNPIKIQLPTSDRIFIVLRVEELANKGPFTSLDDVLLDHSRSAMVERWKLGGRIVKCVHHWVNSRLQLLNCLEDQLTELCWLFFTHPPVKCLTGFSTGQPQFDPIHFLDLRILGTLVSAQQSADTSWEGTHSYCGEEKASRTKCIFDWFHARRVPREI